MASKTDNIIGALLNATKTEAPGFNFKFKSADVSVRENGSVDISFTFNPVPEKEAENASF